MNQIELANRMGVCSWSLQPESPEKLIAYMNEIDLNRVQLALDPLRLEKEAWANCKEKCEQAGIKIISGMFGTIGEDYTTLESIKETGGVVPDQHWDANWEAIQEDGKIAQSLGIELVTFHAGFLPHEPDHPDFKKLSDRIALIADFYSDLGIKLGFETGQETAETLVTFLELLNKPNVGVNFDPANMILYNKGNPVESLKKLSQYVIQCHIKDATYTTTPGTWGEEVATGTGQVDWNGFFDVLQSMDYKGEFMIEREAGNQRVVDIRAARDYIAGLFID